MASALRTVSAAAAWLAFGGGLGAVVPIGGEVTDGAHPRGDAEAAPDERAAALPIGSPERHHPPPEAAPADQPIGFADPCLGIRAVERRVDELTITVQQAMGRFSRRYGVPVSSPPDFDPGAAESHWAAKLGDYPGLVWSTVDCTLYPCTALILSDRPRPTAEIPALARQLVGLEHAWVAAESATEGLKTMDVVTIVLTDTPSDHVGWFHSLKQRIRDQTVAEIRDVMQARATSD